MKNPVPTCGQSDQRNKEYNDHYSPEKYFRSLVSTNAPLIFDVGAHRGESVLFFKEIFPESTIYSFEPEPENFRALKEVCQSYNFASTEAGETRCFNFAIAESDSEMSFYQQEHSHLGGLIPINQSSKDSLGYAARALNREIIVPTRSLDSFCKEYAITTIDVLKIDVQGYEIGVLSGATDVLKRTTICSVEVSLYDFYQESSALLAVERIMQAAEMSLWDISKVSKNPKSFRTDWVELVYKRAGHLP